MRAFAGEYRGVKVHILTKGKNVDGEKSRESFSEPLPDKMVPRPVTLSQEKRLPEGRYKAGDMKFYAAGPVKYKSGDLIEYKDVQYRIGDISDRDEGGYTFYMGKRKYDTN